MTLTLEVSQPSPLAAHGRRGARPRYTIVDTTAVPASYTAIELDFRYPAGWLAPYLRNQFAGPVEAATFEWFEQLGLTPTPELRARVRNMNVAGYAGCSLPMARYEDIELYSRFITLWLLWDDQVVEKRTDTALDEHLRQVLAALSGQLRPEDCEDGYVRAWAELTQTLLHAGRSQHFVERVAASFRSWIEASLVEASLAHAVHRDPRALIARGRWAQVLETRVVTIGIFPTAQLLEHVGGFEFSDEVLADPGIQRLTWLGSLLVALGNEVASAAKDLEGGWLNLVPAHVALHGGDLRTTYATLAEMHAAAIAEFDAVAASLPSWGAKVDAWVQAWASLLRYCASGFARWHFSTPRYMGRTVVDAGQCEFFRPRAA